MARSTTSCLVRASLSALGALLLAVPAHAADIFVPGDHATVQAALLAAEPSDVIHVGPGTWNGPFQMLKPGVTLRGAGADLTVLDGQGAPTTLSVAGVVFFIGVSIEDLSITGGQKGLDATPGSLVFVRRCTVRDNAGIGIAGPAIQVSDSLVSGNGSHGLAEFQYLVGSVVRDNGAWGAISVQGAGSSAPRIWDSTFTGNALGGARLTTVADSVVNPGELHVSGCIFVDDNLQLSALEANGGPGTSFVSHVSLLGGSIKVMQGHLLIDHSILRSDVPVQDFSVNGAAFWTWSNVTGTAPGFTNIDADPLWADAANGDFALLPGSPCINSGNPNLVEKDPDGSVQDMGAVAYHPWTDLGGAIVFAGGRAELTGGGPLVAEEDLSLALDSGPASTGAWLIASATELGAPFKGGTLWPSPDALLGPFMTNALGELDFEANWPASLPSGFAFVSQVWWPEPSAVEGWGASNGLRGVQP